MRVQIDNNTNIDVDGITLLSVDEIQALPEEIRKCDNNWWLRSPGLDVFRAAFVYGEYGDVSVNGCGVDLEFGVRPSLKLSNPASSNLQIGDKVKIFGYVWTVISSELVLCDDIVGLSQFRNDREAEDANKYETSDVKKWLEKWYEDQLTQAA